MKCTLLFLLAGFAACGQKNETAKPGNDEVFNSKYVKLLPDTNRMMLIENVVIRYGDLYAEADSVLLEKPGQTITVFGIKKAQFKGDAVSEEDRKKTIRYRKGEAKLSID
jgi:hypothetical protein